MADITMCTGKKGRLKCTLRETCHRYKATACEYAQSYFVEAPFAVETPPKISCNMYWNTRSTYPVEAKAVKVVKVVKVAKLTPTV